MTPARDSAGDNGANQFDCWTVVRYVRAHCEKPNVQRLGELQKKFSQNEAGYLLFQHTCGMCRLDPTLVLADFMAGREVTSTDSPPPPNTGETSYDRSSNTYTHTTPPARDTAQAVASASAGAVAGVNATPPPVDPTPPAQGSKRNRLTGAEKRHRRRVASWGGAARRGCSTWLRGSALSGTPRISKPLVINHTPVTHPQLGVGSRPFSCRKTLPDKLRGTSRGWHSRIHAVTGHAATTAMQSGRLAPCWRDDRGLLGHSSRLLFKSQCQCARWTWRSSSLPMKVNGTLGRKSD